MKFLRWALKGFRSLSTRSRGGGSCFTKRQDSSGTVRQKPSGVNIRELGMHTSGRSSDEDLVSAVPDGDAGHRPVVAEARGQSLLLAEDPVKCSTRGTTGSIRCATASITPAGDGTKTCTKPSPEQPSKPASETAGDTQSIVRSAASLSTSARSLPGPIHRTGMRDIAIEPGYCPVCRVEIIDGSCNCGRHQGYIVKATGHGLRTMPLVEGERANGHCLSCTCEDCRALFMGTI